MSFITVDYIIKALIKYGFNYEQAKIIEDEIFCTLFTKIPVIMYGTKNQLLKTTYFALLQNGDIYIENEHHKGLLRRKQK